MVLVRLLDEQVAEHWSTIKFCIEKAVPPLPGESTQKYNNLLKEILLGRLQCWALTDEDQQRFRCIITTRVDRDSIAEINTLVLYSVFAFLRITEEDAVAIYEGLRKYGQSQDCTRAIAFTNSNSIVRFLTAYGFVEDWHYLTYTF